MSEAFESRRDRIEPAPISIIVPMHNVAPYLRRCLDSIERQTLQGPEVILIDDASSDGTLAHAREYAHRNPGWKLIELPENRGISAVRNLGVASASRQYIGFVDADDWIKPTMFESLLTAAVAHDADISEIAYVICSSEAADDGRQPADDRIRILTGKEALREMLLRETYAVASRLYRRELFETDREWFPNGLTCEDRIANSWLLPRAERVAVSSRVEYFYYLKTGSISYSGLDTRGLDLLEADEIMVGIVDELEDERLSQLVRQRAAKGPFSLIVKWLRFGVTDPNLDSRKTLNMLWERFRESYPALMSSPLPLVKRVVAWQMRWCPALLKLEFAAYRSTLGRQRGFTRE